VPVGKGGEIKKKVGGVDVVLKRGCTTKRWTFVVGKDKKIAFKNPKVKAGQDAKSILDVVAKLGK